METLNVADAKRRFSELLDRVGKGERFVVSRRGKPAVGLVPLDEVEEGSRPRGLLSLVGILADIAPDLDVDAMVKDIYQARRRARDRPAPTFD